MLSLLLACSEPAPVVLLVSWDTVRWDHVGGGATPVLDGLAAEGVSFTEARTTCPVTLPAHASMLTGRSVAHHGARMNGSYVLDPSVPTLGEAFQDAGWATGGFVSASVLAERYGLARGFDRYDDTLDDPRVARPGSSRHGDRTVASALDWLGQVPEDQPAFVFVHLYDPHLPRDHAVEGLDPYRAEIHYADARTGELLEGIAALERPVRVALTSDHGESLGAHGEKTHGWFIYDTTMRVPLVLSGPGLGAPREVAGRASVIDLHATLLEWAGLPPVEADGMSLLGLDAVPARPLAVESVMAALNFGAAPLFGVHDDEGLWISSKRPEHIVDGQDIWAGDAAALAQRIDAQDWAWPQEPSMASSEEITAQLEALGYMTTESALVDAGRDAKDLVELSGLTIEVWSVLREVPVARRVAVWEVLYAAVGPELVLERAPSVADLGLKAVSLREVQALDALGRPEEASQLLAVRGLDEALEARRRERAEAMALETAIRARLEQVPDDEVALSDLAVVLRRLGRPDEAAALTP